MLFEKDVEHPLLEMPEIECGYGYIVDIFNKTGKILQTGMGTLPLTWLELESFNTRTGCQLTIWESETIMEMSNGYCHFINAGEDHSCLAPYTSENKETVEKRRDNVSNAFLSLAERLSGKGKKQKGLKPKRGKK